MFSIITVGDPWDLRIHQTLLEQLRRRGRVLASSARGVSIPDGPADFFLGDCGCTGAVGGKCLLVIKNEALLPTLLDAPGCTLAVVYSHNRAAVELVAASGLQAVTCGLSSRDTITFTSMDSQSGAIALQRAIQGPDGQLTEQSELPVRITTPQDSYTMLSCAAVLAAAGLLAGEQELVF